METFDRKKKSERKELFTIGEIGKLFHINIRTLRYYDAAGLLKPEKTDPVTGYRYYSTKQFERLNTIKYLRALDMPIERIIRFFENKDTDTLMELLKEQQEEIRLHRERLDQIARKLERRIEQLDDALGSRLGEIRRAHLQRRQIAFLRRDIPLEEDLEYPLRELERRNDLNAVMFLGKVGVSVSREQLLRRQFDGFSEIFVLLEQEDGYEGREEFLEENDFILIRYSGTHKDAGPYYEQLLDYMEKNGLECCGDSVEITLIDSGFTNDTEKYITELQIPVKRA
ncbi:MAG TPA: MerR family transcriptional regulator [Candidatus Lachnoclostridium pullistercoris]|uniref:MerR family transcriptional regulator n=1 Tax=Candidatus Lachnoclostridium pullistercoris TaxID=2838632 RepID=A0A9D2P9R9_9FIRM|nr:MerR family transcriptional regulator [Candidatus Lachnoclostridium pullistercoris]